MKKRGIFLICLAFALLGLAFVSLSNVSAVETPATYEDLQDVADKVPTSPEGAVDVGNVYLRQELSKIMEKYPVGRFFLAISSVLSALDFYWNAVFGMNYSFSLAFVFSIAVWLTLFFIIYELVEAFFDKKWMSIIAGFAIVSLIGLTGVIKRAVDLISIAVNNKWIAVVSLIIAGAVMAAIIYLGGGLKVYLQKLKEEEEKEKTARDRKVIHVEAEVAEEELKSSSKRK